MKRFALIVLLLPAPALADDADDMQAVATGFYSVSTTQRSSGIPQAGLMARYAPFLSPTLSQALNNAAAAEARWTSRNKNAPPILEGNVFSSLFEGATGFTVGACQAQGARGECSITLVHDDKSGARVEWSDTLLLAKGSGGWRVDDVAYGAKWPFANSGTLQSTLKMAIGLSGQ